MSKGLEDKINLIPDGQPAKTTLRNIDVAIKNIFYRFDKKLISLALAHSTSVEEAENIMAEEMIKLVRNLSPDELIGMLHARVLPQAYIHHVVEMTDGIKGLVNAPEDYLEDINSNN